MTAAKVITLLQTIAKIIADVAPVVIHAITEVIGKVKRRHYRS
jgi:hypothetical protein